MNLEDIVTTIKNIVHDIKNTAQLVFETAVHHPAITGITTALATTSELTRTNTTEENIFSYALMAGIAAHSVCSVIRNSVYQKPPTQNLLLQQQSMTALATAGIAAIAAFPDNPADAETRTTMFLANYVLINSFITLVNAQKELKQFYDGQHKKPATTLDSILEKSSALSVITGGVTFAYFAHKFGHGYAHYPAPTLVLNTLLAAAAATVTSFTTLFLTGILHSSTREYNKLSLKAAAQKLVGKYGTALETITELEKIASQNTKAQIELQKAELTIRKGEYGKGLILLRDAITAPHATTRNPLEIISDVTGITTMMTLLQLFMATAYGSSKLFEHGLISYKHGKTATASALISMGTQTAKEDLDNRLLSIYFHSTTRDQHQANRELQKLIQHSRPENFQTIAFSSDEFCIYPSSELMCTIGIKCSKHDLSHERDATHIFYESASNKKQRAQPLAHARKVKHQRHPEGQRDYLCMAYATGIPLLQIEHKETALFDALALILEADAKAQEYADTNHMREIKQLDYFSVFKKFVQRITKNEAQQKMIYAAGAFIPTYLSRGEGSIIHYNPHAGNILKKQDGTLCLIDFGDACKGELALDIEDVTTSLAPKTSREQIYEHCARITNRPIQSKQSTKKNESHFFGALENQGFSTRFEGHRKGVTKTQFQQNGYASVFKTATLFGRSIAYHEGNPTEAYFNLDRVIKEVMTFVPEKLLFQRFADTLMPLTEYLSQEQYANSKQTNTSQQ